MTQEELKKLAAKAKSEDTKSLIKDARDIRKVLAIIDAELQSRKGPSK